MEGGEGGRGRGIVHSRTQGKGTADEDKTGSARTQELQQSSSEVRGCSGVP